MKYRAFIIFIVLYFLCYSCSTINLTSRKDKDFQICFNDSLKLKGRYSNISADTKYSGNTLFDIFCMENIDKRNGHVVDIIPINKKAIIINLLSNDSLIKSTTLKGKYKKGYFRVKRNYSSHFIIGPLIWVLGEDRTFIGLTKTNDLIVLNSGGQSFLFFIIFPFFGGAGNGSNIEYKKIN